MALQHEYVCVNVFVYSILIMFLMNYAENKNLFQTIMSIRTVMSVNRFGPIMSSPLCTRAQ